MLETLVKPKTAKEILEGAHQIMSERGHCQRRFIDHLEGAICTVAALTLAEGREPTYYRNAVSMIDVSPPLAEALRAMGFSYPGEACDFNNGINTTKETVLAKFEEGLAKL